MEDKKNLKDANKKEETSGEERYYVASQWQLMWRKFRKHKLALAGEIILAILFVVGPLFCEFFSTQDMSKDHSQYIHCPPQRIHFFDEDGEFRLRPFVYGLTRTIDSETLRRTYSEDRTKKYPIFFFIHGDKYKLWNLFDADIHLLGVREGTLFLLGTESLGRDLFSRILYAARISLSIGLIGVVISFVLGCMLGGISGYFGGFPDMIIQRIIELSTSIPTIPLWMALSAALPKDWSPIKIYFGITIILSIIGWCSLARVVRGKFLELREEDFPLAARIAGATEGRVIMKHLLPSFLSYLTVSLTLAIPYMILGETSLSFLGLGLRPPVVSWGVLMRQAQNVRSVVLFPWLLTPGLFVIITVLAFNFLGDGLRDAADPYT